MRPVRLLVATVAVVGALASAVPAGAATGSGSGPTGYGRNQMLLVSWGGLHDGREHVRTEAYPWPGSLTAYRSGKAYLKVTVTRKPSTKNTPIQLCIWRRNAGRWVGPGTDETCAPNPAITGTGTFYMDLGSPGGWWARNGRGTFDWSRRFDVVGFEVKNGARPAEVMMYQRCGAYCYSGSDLMSHIPIAFRGEVYLVKPGVRFVPPSTWAGSPWS